ncbi:hypothetical protein [Mangrovivirga cuniculi]|uniref:Uncharacterized protein n=1 Tax=Mangrovivirga cuniculi TaxID=2715131 RepID=A0A4D7JQ40_9BACT|nr:hypothetical protein [Mangrovivirga cuniculi]QCK15590.1 hypothetical protein DCC35_12945 [Mangrovivirga cuniculi]
MKNFDFKKRNLSSGPHLLGLLLVVAGIFVLVSPSFLESGSSTETILAVGIGTLFIGLLIISSYGGIVIDLSQKRFKEYLSIGGYKFGEWTELPEILKIKVISNSYINSNTPNGISPTFSGKVTDFKTLIYSNSSKPVFSFKYSNADDAVKNARHLANDLNADLVINVK